MIRIKDTLINGKEILYIDKYGFLDIRVIFKDIDRDHKLFEYSTEEERDAAFENIDQVGRDYYGEVYN